MPPGPGGWQLAVTHAEALPPTGKPLAVAVVTEQAWLPGVKVSMICPIQLTVTVWPAPSVPVQLMALAATTTVPGWLAVAVPGKVTMFDNVAVKATAALAPVVLVALKLPLTLSPGPAHASGSSNAAPRASLLTVTVKLQLGPAVEEHVTVVVPTLKLPPEAGVHVTVPHPPPLVVGAG